MKKTIVIPGWNIQILFLAHVFLKSNHSHPGFVIPKQEATNEAKKRCWQQGLVCGGNQTGATFVLKLEKCLYFKGQTGSTRFGVPTIIIIGKQ